ncbi:hypothetical protein [Aneurinibacillus sp. REN35]|uniref:hypothetical protein n=1 Tax=Aneurinibacillus sp. REN35 TaxID=3237286 RepID=UPI0035287C1A
MITKTEDRGLDQKILTDILLDIYEKGEQLNMVETRDIVEDIVFQLKPFMEDVSRYD